MMHLCDVENAVEGPGIMREDFVCFELQAIVDTQNLSVYGYEFLFRGQDRPLTPEAWRDVDEGVLRYLAHADAGAGKPCFVNLSHGSVLAIPEPVFAAACARNVVRFEMSEEPADGMLFDRVCEKVNYLTSQGMQFAIDDFGAGLDGSRRLYALDRVAAVKVDRGLLITAAARPLAARMLEAAVSSWKCAGIRTVAEGVESAELLSFAQRLGFDLVQGWHVDQIAPSMKTFIQRSFFNHNCSVLCA